MTQPQGTKVYKIGRTYTTARSMADALRIKKIGNISGLIVAVEITKFFKKAV